MSCLSRADQGRPSRSVATPDSTGRRLEADATQSEPEQETGDPGEREARRRRLSAENARSFVRAASDSYRSHFSPPSFAERAARLEEVMQRAETLPRPPESGDEVPADEQTEEPSLIDDAKSNVSQ